MKRLSCAAWLLLLATAAEAGSAGAQETPAPGVKCWPLKVPSGGQPGFTLLPGTQTGVQFTNELALDAEAANNNLLNGSGVALGDYDGDGWCDIFLCNLNGS